MSVLLLASALALLPRAPLVVNVNAKEGETIRGERAFRVSVAADTAINKVEFYVNGDLQDTDDSTPYEFKLDTVDLGDGPVKVRFKAYTVESKAGEKSLGLKVDNELGKGVAYHIEKAQGLLADGKYAEGRDEGRIALKIEKGNYDARVVLARAYTGLGEWDQAQLQAEEAKAAKPDDPNALSLLAGINVQRAFRIYARPDSDRATVLKDIKEALASAVQARRQALDTGVDAMAKDPVLPYADAAIRARRYGAALGVLKDAYAKDQKNTALANRLAYAYLRTNSRQEAFNVLTTLQRAGSLDAYSYALKAVALADGGDDAGSDEAIREAVLADADDMGVRTAQAYIALKRGKTDVLRSLSDSLSKDQGQRADVRYFQMAIAAKQQNYSDAAKSFRIGVLAEPAMADLYVEYANDAVAISQRGSMDEKEKAQHYAEARAYFETALVARPEASEALAGLAMVAVFENKPAEAVRYAEAAVRAAPMNAGAYYALSAAQSAARNVAGAQEANRRAGQLDGKYLQGRQIPDASAVWRYLDTAGRPIVIAAPATGAPAEG